MLHLTFKRHPGGSFSDNHSSKSFFNLSPVTANESHIKPVLSWLMETVYHLEYKNTRFAWDCKYFHSISNPKSNP